MTNMASGKTKKKPTRPERAKGALADPKHRKMLEVLQQFRLLIKSIRGHYQKVENRSGVSGAQLWALAHIADHPGSKVGELAQALAIHQSTASNLIGRLESLGLVARTRVRHDQRSVELALTAKGAQSISRAPRPLIGVLQQALSDIPEASLGALHQHLGRLISTMKIRDTKGRSVPLSDM
jgi:MarR family transcriptional regulator, organic hydroperoxide resistance regulator